MKAGLPKLVAQCFQANGLEVTIECLLSLVSESDAPTLKRLAELQATLDDIGLELLPPLGEGDLNRLRVMRPKVRSTTIDKVLGEIASGESEELELKASLIYDRRRAIHDPRASLQELKSAEVLHASLKTIAAFINSDGGVLVVGVEDDGGICGIEDDFRLLKDSGFDGWELFLRDTILSAFVDGDLINNYVRIEKVQVNDHSIARVTVQPRQELCFLRKEGRMVCYCRQGNRTAEVTIDRIIRYASRRTFRRSSY